MLSACTIVAANYLPFARVLAESFLSHHSGASFIVLLIDDEQRTITLDDNRIQLWRLADLGLNSADIHKLAAIYDVTELATAVKPLLLKALIDKGLACVTYLDPDIRVYAPLVDVEPLAAGHGIVLTPHTTQPYPRDTLQVDELFILAAGVYNLGFIAVTAAARPFLDWWWQVTRRGALSDVSRNMFTDQRWIDFVPSFYDHAILKDPGYNVAYWNLHSRTLALDGDCFVVDGVPLRFFHFSGFNPSDPERLSKHQGDRPRIRLEDRPVLARLCADYAAELRRAGFGRELAPAYGWKESVDGLELTSRIRRLYREALIEAEERGGPFPPDPFDRARPHDFLAWLKAPPEGGATTLPRYLHSIYQDRVDLHIQFPDIAGKDAARFSDWIWLDSDLRETIPMELLPADGQTRAAARAASGADAQPDAQPDAGRADGSAIAPLESMLPHLEAMTTWHEGTGGSFASLRRTAQRLLLRVLRPYAFQQQQLHLQIIAALRQTVAALRRQQQLNAALDARLRDVTRELVAARQDIRRLERTQPRQGS